MYDSALLWATRKTFLGVVQSSRNLWIGAGIGMSAARSWIETSHFGQAVLDLSIGNLGARRAPTLMVGVEALVSDEGIRSRHMAIE